MAAAEHKPVPVKPLGIAGVVPHHMPEQQVPDVRHPHRRPRVPRSRLLHGVDDQHPDVVDGTLVHQLLQGVAGEAVGVRGGGGQVFGALELVQPGELVVAGEAAARGGRAACMAAVGEGVEPWRGRNWDVGRREVKIDDHGHGWAVCIGLCGRMEEKGSCVHRGGGAMAGGALVRGVEVEVEESNHVGGCVAAMQTSEVAMSKWVIIN